MHRKTIAVSCGEALAPSRVRDLFAHMDAEVSVLKVPLSDALAAHRGLGSGIDLFVVDATSDADFLQVGPMSINLATYQVKVGDDPIDLTYMEYELLSFLVTHPDRIYSREVLLSQVWGFDYYGGTRTVDVHVRRLRAKLGPEVAQRIETVRGAGYLWSN